MLMLCSCMPTCKKTSSNYRTAPGRMMQLLASKVEETGCKRIVLDTRKVAPSHVCPVCHARRKKVLAKRMHVCTCGFWSGRDDAAAL